MLMTCGEVAAKLATGATLYLAGDERLLATLPAGNWIAGTIPYFMDGEGVTSSHDLIFVQEQSPAVIDTRIASYTAENLQEILQDAPEHGFTLLILPAMSAVHLRYAREAPCYPDLFLKPITGWVAGVDLVDVGRVPARVYDGRLRQSYSDRAVALHAGLAAGKTANIGVVNLFEAGDGDRIRFAREGFVVDACQVNGEPCNFADYLRRHRIDTRLPLVADYNGESINVSVQKIDAQRHCVELYAPVFAGVEYRFAKAINDYAGAFAERIPKQLTHPPFSCNCVLNYVYSEIDGRLTTANLTGPITFGEIAYVLLNQTLVYLQITDDPASAAA